MITVWKVGLLYKFDQSLDRIKYRATIDQSVAYGRDNAYIAKSLADRIPEQSTGFSDLPASPGHDEKLLGWPNVRIG